MQWASDSATPFPEVQRIKKTGEKISSETFSIMASQFIITVFPSGEKEEHSGFVTIYLHNSSGHRVVVDYTITVGDKVNCSKSKLFESKKSWGFNQCKISETGQNMDVTIDVTLVQEDILNVLPGGTTQGFRGQVGPI